MDIVIFMKSFKYFMKPNEYCYTALLSQKIPSDICLT